MRYMLAWNRVRDYDTWKAVFDDQSKAAEAGLRLLHLWRTVEDPNVVYFLLEVGDMQKAEAFVHAPESAEAGERAGVIEGDITYLEDVP